MTRNVPAGRRWHALHRAQMQLVDTMNNLRPGADFTRFCEVSDALQVLGQLLLGIEQTRRGRSAKVGRWSR